MEGAVLFADVAGSTALYEVLGDELDPGSRAAWERATMLITELMQTP